MANVTVSISRDNGMSISAVGEVSDEMVVEIAATLGAMLFDASATPLPTPTPSP